MRIRMMTCALATLIAAVPAARLAATCGGGGGGGLGGITPSAPGAPQVYRVPWQVLGPGAAAPTGALLVYWFPTSPEEARGSGLATSRPLTLAAGQCVAMGIITGDNQAARSRYQAPDGAPLVVLAAADGSELARVAADGGKLEVRGVEKAVKGELDRREDATKEALATAQAKQKAGDADGAAALYQQVLEQRCLFPSIAKKAAKALEKMGRPLPEGVAGFDGGEPDDSEATTAAIVALMEAGLGAERELRLADAERLYGEAHRLDPADPVPLRYLAEFHRHHSGDWDRATGLFQRLLAMPADPLSRAVALHGLGKMTIHAGEFARGVAMFEESVRTYPLALAYRNLAVYWNSERDFARAWGYVEKALALEPEDVYNQIFAATYYVQLGRPEEARRIVAEHAGVLEASYNLAAIWAQLGDREKMLELLGRHFHQYEQTDAVRRREMQEARDDVIFASFHRDPRFVLLTALAGEDTSSHRMRGRRG